MYKNYLALLFLLFSFYIVHAQNAVLNFGTINNGAQKMFELDMLFNQQGKQAVSLELPEFLIQVPVTIKQNGRDLWLKESSDAPQKMDHLHWARTGRLLTLRFVPDQISAGDTLKLILNYTPVDVSSPDSVVTLRDARIDARGNITPGVSLATVRIPSSILVENQ